MFSEYDLNNILVIVDFAFKNGMVKSQEDAKVLLVLEGKTRQQLAPPAEVEDGDDVPASD